MSLLLDVYMAGRPMRKTDSGLASGMDATDVRSVDVDERPDGSAHVRIEDKGGHIVTIDHPPASFAAAASHHPVKETTTMNAPAPMTALETTVFGRAARASAAAKYEVSDAAGFAVLPLAVWEGFTKAGAPEASDYRLLVMKHSLPAIAEAAKAFHKHDAELQAEFSSAEVYSAYVTGTLGGAVRVLAAGAGLAKGAGDTRGLPSPTAGEAAWRAAWQSDQAIRNEFVSEEGFMAYMRQAAREAGAR